MTFTLIIICRKLGQMCTLLCIFTQEDLKPDVTKTVCFVSSFLRKCTFVDWDLVLWQIATLLFWNMTIAADACVQVFHSVILISLLMSQA